MTKTHKTIISGYLMYFIYLILAVLLGSCKSYTTQYTVVTKERKYYTDIVVQDTIYNQIYFSEYSRNGSLKPMQNIPFKQVVVVKSNYQNQ